MIVPQQLSIALTDAGPRMIDNTGADTTYYTDGRKTEKEVGAREKDRIDGSVRSCVCVSIDGRTEARKARARIVMKEAGS